MGPSVRMCSGGVAGAMGAALAGQTNVFLERVVFFRDVVFIVKKERKDANLYNEKLVKVVRVRDTKGAKVPVLDICRDGQRRASGVIV